MKKISQIKVLLAGIALICFLCLLYFVLRQGELAWGASSARQSSEKKQGETGASQELQRLLWKDLSLDGKKYRYSSDYETYLFIGTDGSGNEEAEREEYTGDMADFLLLAAVNRTEQTCTLLQLNRDTITEIPLLGKNGKGAASADMQLCTAHWYGGTRQESCENTVKAVSDLLGGIAIDGYYSMSMEELPALNHAVGGVTVTIESDFSRIDPSMKMGETMTLSDEQAYTFVRSRYGVDDEENISRMERQQQYMKALFKKIREKTDEDSGFALRFYEELSKKSVTNMSGGLISDLVAELAGSGSTEILQLEGESRTGQKLGDGIEHAEFYLNQNAIVKTLKKMYNIVDNR